LTPLTEHTGELGFWWTSAIHKKLPSGEDGGHGLTPAKWARTVKNKRMSREAASPAEDMLAASKARSERMEVMVANTCEQLKNFQEKAELRGDEMKSELQDRNGMECNGMQ
jgi:hypothetical protein